MRNVRRRVGRGWCSGSGYKETICMDRRDMAHEVRTPCGGVRLGSANMMGCSGREA